MEENIPAELTCPKCGEVIENSNGQDAVANDETAADAASKTASQFKEWEDKYLRLFAEFDNYKRRTAREILDIRMTAAKDLMVSLLDVLDNCERAEKQIKSTVENEVTSGTLLVFNQLRNTLTQRGLKPMESLHEDFDVEKHEAITQVEVPENLKGKVIDELMKGYYLNDKIIRFAKVVVGQ